MLALSEQRQSCLSQSPRPEEVDLDDLLRLGEVGLGGRHSVVRKDAGVVYQDVELTRIGADRLDQAFDRGRFGDLERQAVN
jgi:hypothetical protein